MDMFFSGHGIACDAAHPHLRTGGGYSILLTMVMRRQANFSRLGLKTAQALTVEDDWEFAWGVIAGTLDIDRLDRWVCRLEAMAPAEVISLQQRMEARAA